MKKIFVLTILLSLIVAGSAMAAQTISATDANGQTLTGSNPATQVIGKCSKGVRIGVTYSTTGYSMITVHMNGSKYYGSAFDSTSIFSTSPAGDINAAFSGSVPSTSVSSTAFASPWAAM